MEKKESGGLINIWTRLVVVNPRAAIAIGCTLIIMAESWVVIALYRDSRKSYDALLRYHEVCSNEKIEIIYNAIQKQEAFNSRYEARIDGLYERLNEINSVIKSKKK